MRPRALVSLAGIVACAIVSVPARAQSRAAAEIKPALQAIADTERAFARLGAEKGVRESFLQYFAPEGVWFVPGPSNTAADLRKRPAPTGPPQRKLEWAPMYGDVSSAGDLGYSTGPSANSDLTAEKTPTRYGYFFSIWKKQPKGDWRVILDIGSEAPDVWDPARPPRFRPAPPSGFKSTAKPALEKEITGLIAAERAFSRAAQTVGAASASARFLDPDARLYRNGISPVIGRDNIHAFLGKNDFRPRWEPMESNIAKSADLGYSYGRYWAPGIGKNGAEETGYYVHVWRKDVRGDWKLVFHVTSPADFAKK